LRGTFEGADWIQVHNYTRQPRRSSSNLHRLSVRGYETNPSWGHVLWWNVGPAPRSLPGRPAPGRNCAWRGEGRWWNRVKAARNSGSDGARASEGPEGSDRVSVSDPVTLPKHFPEIHPSHFAISSHPPTPRYVYVTTRCVPTWRYLRYAS